MMGCASRGSGGLYYLYPRLNAKVSPSDACQVGFKGFHFRGSSLSDTATRGPAYFLQHSTTGTVTFTIQASTPGSSFSSPTPMGSNDVPPAHCPSWVVPTSTALLGVGVLFWDATYILMTRRALVTKTYGMPLFALALNVSWELVYAVYVSEMLLEKLAFAFWLLLDIGLIYTTVQFGPEAWRLTNPWVGRHIRWIFTLMTVFGCWGHYTFAAWWMSEPHRGSGDKTGKFWAGRDGYDATEVAFWSAAVCQLAGSAGSLAMLMSRGHSGGTSYLIWLCRTLGTLVGLVLANVFLWWFWPEAHGFVFNPFAIFLWGTSLVCDITYPFVLWQVRRSEVVLPDGTLAMSRPREAAIAAPRNHDKKKQ